MAVKIRLARRGRKLRPCYDIVAANSRSPRDGRFLQKLGRYNPLLDDTSPARIVVDKEKVSYWLYVGAQPTEVVKRLFNKVGL